MAFNSLLWLENSRMQQIDAPVVKDLGMTPIYEKLIKMSPLGESVIDRICLDEATLTYRQHILSDFMDQPALMADLSESLKEFTVLKHKLHKGDNRATNFYTLVNLVMMVEATIQCLESLHSHLSYHRVTAEGLLTMRARITETLSSETFRKTKKDLREIRYVFRTIASAELSVNLNQAMRPNEAMVTDVNQVPYRFPMAFRKVADTLEQDHDFLGRYLQSYNPVFGVGILDWDLLDELEYAFRSHRTVLVDFLTSYESIDISPYMQLLQEITFYHASCALLNQLKSSGFPLCFPSFDLQDPSCMVLHRLYNIRTAFRLIEQHDGDAESHMVYNDFHMARRCHDFVLTGANRGGKTTFTQAIGQIRLLAQLGLMVPAASASLGIVDQIFTHFPVQEKETVDLGRLGKECQMFVRLFHQATERSLILMNEAFTGTSYLESLNISLEALRAIQHKGVSLIFNTHLHELAKGPFSEDPEVSLEHPVVSLIAGHEQDACTYIIQPGLPLGSSYARDIAEKYGVTFEQLTCSKGGRSL